jgi:hypothetical protein
MPTTLRTPVCEEDAWGLLIWIASAVPVMLVMSKTSNAGSNHAQLKKITAKRLPQRRTCLQSDNGLDGTRRKRCYCVRNPTYPSQNRQRER